MWPGLFLARSVGMGARPGGLWGAPASLVRLVSGWVLMVIMPCTDGGLAMRDVFSKNIIIDWLFVNFGVIVTAI